VYAGSPKLTVQTVTITVACQDGLGDNSGSVNSGSNGLGKENGAVGDRWSSSNDLRGDDRAETMADGYAGETTGVGDGDSQDGSEDSL
ncbi:hypothetical protein ALC57_06824, partial [Trachymyrmex cornetzi]